MSFKIIPHHFVILCFVFLNILSIWNSFWYVEWVKENQFYFIYKCSNNIFKRILLTHFCLKLDSHPFLSLDSHLIPLPAYSSTSTPEYAWISDLINLVSLTLLMPSFFLKITITAIFYFLILSYSPFFYFLPPPPMSLTCSLSQIYGFFYFDCWYLCMHIHIRTPKYTNTKCVDTHIYTQTHIYIPTPKYINTICVDTHVNTLIYIHTYIVILYKYNLLSVYNVSCTHFLGGWSIGIT